MLGPCWQQLFALNRLAPDHSSIRPATLSPPALRHKGSFAYEWPMAHRVKTLATDASD